MTVTPNRPSARDLLTGSSVPGAFDKLTPDGTRREGEIVAVGVVQRTQYGTNVPLYWVNRKPSPEVSSSPVWDVVIDFCCAPVTAEDSGVRRFYVKSKEARHGLREALAAAGADEPEVGGSFGVTLVGRVPTQALPRAMFGGIRYARPGTPLPAAPVMAPPAGSVPAQQFTPEQVAAAVAVAHNPQVTPEQMAAAVLLLSQQQQDPLT